MATTTGSKRLLSISSEAMAASNSMTYGGLNVATEQFVSTQVSNLISSAPGALDTLNELAAAIGDDSNFATTVTNSIATKLDASVNPLKAASVSNDTITFTRADNTTFAITTSDANTDTNYYLNGITRSGNTLTFSVSGTTNRTYTFGSAAWSATSAFDAAGSADAVNTRIDSEIIPLIDGKADASHTHAYLPLAGGTITGSLTVSGSQTRGTYTTLSQYHSGADNIVLKGNASGISSIFFESEKDGTNINHPSDFGFIQYHAYGTSTTGESNELIIGVSNDADDHVILNAPNVNGLKFRTGVSATDYTVYHSGNLSLATLGYTGATNANYITNNNQLTNGAGYATETWVNEQNFATDAAISTAIGNVTLATLGFTGAANANYITNNNQLTNGAGYITSFDITTQTDGKYLRSNANDTFTGTITMGKQHALVANNYGRGVYGVYSATRYQHVWGMGTAYNLADDGTGTGNLYGVAWTHSNVGGESISGLGHQMLIMSNGDTRSALGDGIWTKYNVYADGGNSTEWNQAYDWGNHASAGYLTTSGKAADSNLLDGLDSSRFLYTTSGQFSGDWNTLTDSDREIRLVEVHNITGGAHSNHPTGLYTYGSVLGWQLDNSTFKLYNSHTGDLAFQTGWNNDGYSGWRTIIHSANIGSQSVNYATTAGSAPANGGNADTLDGINSTSFLRSDANDTHSGELALTSITGASGTIANTKGSYLHIGAWGVARTADTAVLVNTAYRSDILSYTRSFTIGNTARNFNGSANVSWSLADIGAEAAGAAAVVDGRIDTEVLPAIGAVTLATLGYTGATNANYITNNNQLTNGAGYLTSSNDRVYITDSRGSARAPSYYNDRYAQWDFQNVSDTGVGGDGWHALLTVSKWSSYDNSHRQEQLIFSGEHLWRRTATSDSAWGANKKIWDSGNLDAFVGATVSNDTITFTQANGGTVAVTTSDANSWRGIDDTPVNGQTGESISSNWAYDHVNASNPHGTTAADVGADAAGAADAVNTRIDEDVLPAIPTNNNQLTNGAGYITDGNTNWNNTYGFIASGDTQEPGGWTSATKFKSSGQIADADSGSHSLQVISDNNNDAFMAFHVSGDYAVFFGLDGATNRLHTGGWSAGATSYQIWDSRDFNQTSINNWNAAHGWGNHAGLYDIAGSGLAYADIVNTRIDEEVLPAIPSNNNQLTNGAGYVTASAAAAMDFNGYHIYEVDRIEMQGENKDVKFSVWNGTTYGIGMTSGVTYGGLNDYAMTFCMNNDTDRGFWWGYSGQTKSAGAMSLTTGGILTVASSITAGGDITAFSDARVKENIETIDNALDKVTQLRGVEYNRIGAEERSIGVIAQEVQEVLPEVVREGQDGMLSVAYGNITGVLIEAIKEQQKQIEELKAQLDGLTK